MLFSFLANTTQPVLWKRVPLCPPLLKPGGAESRRLHQEMLLGEAQKSVITHGAWTQELRMEMLGGGSSPQAQENIFSPPQNLSCGCSSASSPSQALAQQEASCGNPTSKSRCSSSPPPNPKLRIPEGWGEQPRLGSGSCTDFFFFFSLTQGRAH